jgi:putative restriction endonuclease
MVAPELLDAAMRQAAVAHLRALGAARPLTSDDLAAGFMFDGQRVPLINPQRGIFKPRAMPYLLSIRTVYSRSGARIWYDDQRVSTVRSMRVKSWSITRSWAAIPMRRTIAG